MPDPQPPPLGEPAPLREPRGALLHARFAGVLEGRRELKDAAALEGVAAELRALRLARVELEQEGGRFSLLLGDEPIPPARWRAVDAEAFVALLQRLVDASSAPRAVESNLRCTELYERDVVETLFAVADGVVRPLSRVRPAQAADRRDPRARAAAPPTKPARKLALALLALLAFVGVAWQGGWIDALLRPELAPEAVDAGPFDGLIEVELRSPPGGYALALARGPRYPRTGAEVEALQAAATTPLERAAVAAVSDGRTLFAQLVDEEQRVLAAYELDLRPLLTGDSARVRARLPGLRAARGLRLALQPGAGER